MVTKAYLRASEDSITGAKQKVHTFQARNKVVQQYIWVFSDTNQPKMILDI